MKLSTKDRNFLLSSLEKFFPSQEYDYILFGSFAKGSPHARSDVDIAIKGAKPLDLSQWQLLIEHLEESAFPRKVDVVDYHRVGETFKKCIDQTGLSFKPQ